MKKPLILALVALFALVAAAPAMAQNEKGSGVQLMVGCSGENCWPTYSYRDLDTDVIAIQYLLRFHGYASFEPNNGYFGPLTLSAVKRFQRAEGIPANGVVGARTWEALIVPLSSGQLNEAVKAVQVELRDQYRYSIPVTGFYGTITFTSVKDFQSRHGLQPTGNMDRLTWRSLIASR